MSETLPQWIEDYAQECRMLFGLDDWQIVVKTVDAPNGDKGNEGFSWVDVRYITARIELRRDLDMNKMRHVTMHEFLHVALAPIAQAHLRVPNLIPKSHRKHARQLLDDGVEQTIERLTRALQRQIKLVNGAET